MNAKVLIVAFLLIYRSISGFSQDVRLTVLDDRGSPVESAEVVVLKEKTIVLSSLTSALGYVELPLSQNGRYIIIVRHLSYEEFEKEIFYNGENIQLIEYLRRVVKTDSITIIGNTKSTGLINMDEKQYKLMPASFQDPARALIKYPGFTTTNDQSNAVRFRGFSAESIQWQLMGADIINPNHLSNTGTVDDFSAVNSGGVNAISGSALGAFRFINNPADVSNGNTMSGISQLKYSEFIKSYAEFSLIGPEIGLNLNAGERNTYLIGRYSFVGLLNRLGVSFGNEAINYGDLSLYSDLVKKDNKSLKVYLTLGQSGNLHQPSETIEQFKDIQTIDFRSKLLIAGLQYNDNFINGKSFSATLNYSIKRDKWERILTDEAISIMSSEIISPLYYNLLRNLHHSILSGHSSYKVVSRNQITQAGIRLNFNSFSNGNNPSISSVNTGQSLKFVSVYPYISSQRIINDWVLGIGAAGLYDNLQNNRSFEPWLSSRYEINKQMSTKFTYRYSTMMLNGFYYVIPDGGKELRRPAGHHLQADFRVEDKNSTIALSSFYHSMDGQVAAFSENNAISLTEGYQPISHLSVRNLDKNLNIFGGEIFANQWIATNNGNIELNFNASYFFRNEKFNIREREYTLNATAKWEHTLNKTGQKSISLWLNYHRSIVPFGTSRDFGSYFFGLQLMDFDRKTIYSRWDFRFNYTFPMISSKFKARLSLDVQNVTGIQSEFFRYFDFLNQELRLQKSLGVIPVLSFRLGRS